MVCYFHNLSGFDSHFLIKALNAVSDDIRIKVIPNNTERYIAFKLFIDDFEVRFIDTCKFLNAPLDTLVKELNDDQFVFTKRHFGDKFELMKRKGVLCYEYLDSFDKLDETSLPGPEKFFNLLTETDISQEDYEHALKVWDTFNIETMRDYVELYLTSDVLLLADISENFRKIFYDMYLLDFAHYFTLPSLSFSAMLRITKVELELLTDVDMLLFFERGVRGGLSQVGYRYAEANNKFMNNYDPGKPDVYLMLLDFVNLYGYAMTQNLPEKDFRWMSRKEIADFDLQSSDGGCVLEVDLVMPEHLHDKFKYFSPCVQQLFTAPGSKLPKLVASCYKAIKYVVYVRTLQLYVSLGVVVTEIHRGIKFHESDWLSKYVAINSKKRENATSAFEKTIWKNATNACYGKFLENIKKRRIIKMSRSWDGRYGARKYVSDPCFKKITIFGESLAAVEMKKSQVYFDKALYVGQCILDISKLRTYDVYYNFLQKYIGVDNLTLAYTDTDSFFILVRNYPIYDLIKQHPYMFDTSDYDESNVHGIQRLNKKKIGLLKDETNGKSVTHIVALRSKLYSYQVEGLSPVKKAKGLKKNVVKRLTFNDYKSALFGGEYPKYGKQYSIRSRLHEVFTVEENKATLSAYDDKRFVAEDNIDTFPWGHYRIKTKYQ